MSRRMFLAGLATACLPIRVYAASDTPGVTATARLRRRQTARFLRCSPPPKSRAGNPHRPLLQVVAGGRSDEVRSRRRSVMLRVQTRRAFRLAIVCI